MSDRTSEITQQETIIFEGDGLEEDVDKIDIDAKKRKIFTTASDPEIESLYSKHKRGKLVVQPDFQRHYVWDSKKASRLIESALLGIPLPVIYLAEEEDGHEYVIDGQQRLTSFFSFIDSYFPNGKKFKLNGLQVFQELNGKTFQEIEEKYQDKVRYCELRTITFKKESDSELRFEIFERLNTGAVSLNDQELRNCIYRGAYNDLLKELSSYSEFRSLLGLKDQEPRMKDVELVLRFASFYHQTYLNYKAPVRSFLNKDMETYRNINKNDADELRKSFKNSVLIIKSLLGDDAFKRYYPGDENNSNGSWEQKQFNASLYDILMYSFAKEDINTVYQNLDSIREGYIELFNDLDFVDAILLSTSNKEKVIRRFDKARSMLQGIIGINKREQRCFTYDLKETLFKNNQICAICLNKIDNIDDAAVDHIKQYWTGGATIPANARLAHRYCNWSRPRKDKE